MKSENTNAIFNYTTNCTYISGGRNIVTKVAT